jgi:hypothetical protein
VFLTNASVQQPLKPFDDDDRSLIENCCIKAAKQPWELGHPPQEAARAVRVHVVCTVLMFALATAYRLQCEPEATGGEPVGWQRWRRQLLEQTRDDVIVFTQGDYGIFHLAEYSLLLRAKLKDVPQGSVHSRISWSSMSLQGIANCYVGISGSCMSDIDKTSGLPSLSCDGNGRNTLAMPFWAIPWDASRFEAALWDAPLLPPGSRIGH